MSASDQPSPDQSRSEEGAPDGLASSAPREPTRRLPSVPHEPTRRHPGTAPEQTRRFPSAPDGEGTSTTNPAADPEDEFIGMKIGDAVLRTRIGEGGMGLVYEAWQEPPGRSVAAKLIRAAVASEEARFRFQHEARVLASLRHPAIAQIHTAGTHRAGVEIPYFLMEFVPNARLLTDFVHEEGLSLDATLTLFAEVCRGVQAGHARGIIHRDLKPANILVDEQGQPKIIDFGIARMAEDDETEQTPKTRTGELVGTVPYMSPEQFTGNRMDIDTRTDVYALGVILYEVLTGTLPYDYEGLGLLDVIRKIQTEPPRPPAKLRADLAGDVSVILLKALAKEPDARYAGAAALADDLDRFCQQRPILARPPSVRYQLRMYARRHKGVVLSLAAVGITLIVSLVAISLFAASESRARDHAERQEKRARALLAETAAFIPEVADHVDRQLGRLIGATQVRDQLAEKLAGLATRLAGIEGVGEAPEVAYAIGRVQASLAAIRGQAGGASLGRTGEALALYQSAIAQFRTALLARPELNTYRATLVEAETTLAGQYLAHQFLEEARVAIANASVDLEAWAQRAPEDPAMLAEQIHLQRIQGHLAWASGELENALTAYQKAQVLTETYPWSDEQAVERARLKIFTLLDLATTLAALERMDEAAVHFGALSKMAAQLGEGDSDLVHVTTLWHVRSKLGDFLLDHGDAAGAAAQYRLALGLAQSATKRDPNNVEGRRNVRVSHAALGAALERTKDYEGAYGHYVQALDATRIEVRDEPESTVLGWDLRVALTGLATVEANLQKDKEAREHLAEARAIQTARVARMPDRADEVAGLAEVDYTEALLILARMGNGESAEQEIEIYTAAADALQSASTRLEGLAAEDRLAPTAAANLERWKSLEEILRDAVKKVQATR